MQDPAANSPVGWPSDNYFSAAQVAALGLLVSVHCSCLSILAVGSPLGIGRLRFRGWVSRCSGSRLGLGIGEAWVQCLFVGVRLGFGRFGARDDNCLGRCQLRLWCLWFVVPVVCGDMIGSLCVG